MILKPMHNNWGWLGTVTGIIGGLMVALNFEYSKFGYIFVQQTRISEILKGSRSITSDTAIRLGKYFDNSPQYWLNLQDSFDLTNCNVENYHSINPIERVAQ